MPRIELGTEIAIPSMDAVIPLTDLTSDPDYALFCQERLQDPHRLFRRLRAEDPVHWCEPMSLWFATRYDDAMRGLRDPRLSSRRTGIYLQALSPGLGSRVQPLIAHLSNWLQMTDEPDHGRLRKLVSAAFASQAVEAMRPRLEALVDEFLDALPVGRPVDLLESFCLPFPATVICELLGVPVSERDRFRSAAYRLSKFSGRGGPDLNQYAGDALAALEDLSNLFAPLIEERRTAGKNDLLAAMANAHADGERLSRDEMLALCVFLFIAGHETTASGIANGVLALLRHPDQFAALKADPDGLVAGAIEEALRYESPVPRSVRVARDDMELGGKRIRSGQLVVMLLGAANRDPAQFPNPDVFDIRRKPSRTLAFGHGLHFCLGALLARLEMDIAFRTIAKRLPNLRLADETILWKTAMGLRAPQSLPIIAAS